MGIAEPVAGCCGAWLAACLYFPRVEMIVEAGSRLLRILYESLGIEDRVSRQAFVC